MEKKKSSFSGQIGFVLAAAGSAVGVGLYRRKVCGRRQLPAVL